MHIKKRHPLVLIVDDQDATLGQLSRLFSYHGYDVRVASDGVDALSKIEGVQLVVTDYHMPHISGCDLADMIHKRKPDLPVVIITGVSRFEFPPEKFLKHASTVAYKPFAPSMILNIAKNILAGRLFAKVICPGVFS